MQTNSYKKLSTSKADANFFKQASASFFFSKPSLSSHQNLVLSTRPQFFLIGAAVIVSLFFCNNSSNFIGFLILPVLLFVVGAIIFKINVFNSEKTNVFKKKIQKIIEARPSNFRFFLLILSWVSFAFFITCLYDPYTQVTKGWWLHMFLSIDGMVIMMLLPYNRFTRYVIWYCYLTMIGSTFFLLLMGFSILTSYCNNELSLLSVYTNPLVEFILVYGETIKSFL